MKKIILFSLATLLLISSCGRKKHDESTKIETAVPVKVTEGQHGTIYETISLSGDIYGQKEAKVYAKVPGKLIKKVKSEGEPVKENQIIALISRDEEAMDFADAEVKSPIDGIISKYFIGLGESVFPMQTPVVMVADINKLIVEVYVSGKDLSKIKRGQSAKIGMDIFPNRVFWGQVVEVEPVINPATRKSKVKIELENKDGLLRPGMFAMADIIINVHRGIVVSVNAVLKKDDKEFVFVIDDENRAKLIYVTTGMKDNEKIIIKEGLKKGQKVIFEGNYALIEGTKIEITGGYDR